MFSHLKTALDALGRTGSWDPATRTGNPITSVEVRQYKAGYGRMQRERGFEEGSAVPWQQADVFAVIDQLDVEAAAAFQQHKKLLAEGKPLAATAPLVKGLLLDRDALAITLEWWGLQRGKETGSLTRADFSDEEGNEVLSRLDALLASTPEKVKVGRGAEQARAGIWLALSPLPLLPLSCLQVRISPYDNKQHPLVRQELPVLFTVDSAVGLQYQLVPRLAQHLRLSAQAQQEYPSKSFAVLNFILRPKHPYSDAGFQDKAWSSGE